MARTAEAQASTELDVKQARELRIQDKAAQLQQVFLDSGIPFEEGNRDERGSLEAALDIALRIANAGSEEEIFDPGKTLDGKDLVDRPFTVATVPVARRSTFEGGIGWYFQFTGQVLEPATGELVERVISVGALNVLTAMAALHKSGRLLGRGFKLEASQKTASGYSALWLKPAPEIAGLAAVAAAGDDEPF